MLVHITATTTLDTYGHLFPDQLDDVAEKTSARRTAALREAACSVSLKPSGLNPIQGPETTNGDPRRESPSSCLACCYFLVEPRGVEPLTSGMQDQCSTN